MVAMRLDYANTKENGRDLRSTCRRDLGSSWSHRPTASCDPDRTGDQCDTSKNEAEALVQGRLYH